MGRNGDGSTGTVMSSRRERDVPMPSAASAPADVAVAVALGETSEGGGGVGGALSDDSPDALDAFEGNTAAPWKAVMGTGGGVRPGRAAPATPTERGDVVVPAFAFDDAAAPDDVTVVDERTCEETAPADTPPDAPIPPPPTPTAPPGALVLVVAVWVCVT